MKTAQDRTPNPFQQQIGIDPGNRFDELKELSSLYEMAVDSSVKEIQDTKDEYDRLLKTFDSKHSYSWVARLDHVPEIMCCSCFGPEMDFTGRILQDVSDLGNRMEPITLSIIPGGTEGFIVFQWLGNTKGPSYDLVRSFADLEDERKGDAIVRLALTHSENVFISPTWWDNLDSNEQKDLSDLMVSGFTGDGHHRSFLNDTGKSCVEWRIQGITINLPIGDGESS